MPMFRAALLAATLITPALLSAALNARPMTPEDVARLQQLGAAAISRDGTRVAYTTLSRPDVTRGEANGGARQRLFLADGPLQARAFLPDDMNVSAIGFTPDGGMITFLWSRQGERRSLWGIPVDGGSYRQLAAVNGADIISYSFAPDGQTAYLLAGPAADSTREAQARAGFNARVFEEEHRFNRLLAARITGEAIDAEPREVPIPGFVDTIEISEDGRIAVITTAPTPLVNDSYVAKRVNILDLATGALTEVATPGKVEDVEISPDGTQLSMIAAVSENDPAATTIHLVDVATGAFRALNAGAAEAARDAEWMADGRLATVIHVGAHSRLRFYGPAGNVLSETETGPLLVTALDQGGNRLFARASSAEHPTELFQFDQGRFTRWTAHNPWLAEITFGPQRTLTYTARDGQEIEGILIEPVGGIPEGGAPLILNVHGGPEAHDSNGWITGYANPGQVAAGAGYAVFLPNYRGSTGYGTAFSMQHQRDAAGKEFDDLVDAKHALVALGIADPARVGITGGSYGGFASAWAATRYSDEFAAAVMSVGISNLYSKFGTTDIPDEEYLVHARFYPWEDLQATLERSPIYHAGNATTPILIMHGEQDPRVHPGQSLELYRHIRVRRPETPVRLVLYPGEGHGNAQAAARYDYNLRMMEWFDTYLKSGNRTAPLPPPRPPLPAGAAGSSGSN